MHCYPQYNPCPKKINDIEAPKFFKAEAHLGTTPVVRLSSSRKAPNLTDGSNDGVNTHAVKPVGFNEFVKAVRHLGFFGTAINQPPLLAAKEKP